MFMHIRQYFIRDAFSYTLSSTNCKIDRGLTLPILLLCIIIYKNYIYYTYYMYYYKIYYEIISIIINYYCISNSQFFCQGFELIFLMPQVFAHDTLYSSKSVRIENFLYCFFIDFI